MLHKQFIIAISKSDMLDEELKAEIEQQLPKNIPHIFISSVTQQNLQPLKDLLWKALNYKSE
jgi:GTPase